MTAFLDFFFFFLTPTEEMSHKYNREPTSIKKKNITVITIHDYNIKQLFGRYRQWGQ